MIHFKDNKNKSPLNTRWAQMTKQEQIIERKKIEIKAKLEAQKQAAALAAQAKLANPASDDNSANIFSNDGSFMNQFKTLLEKQKQENAVNVQKEQKKSEEETKESGDYDGEPVVEQPSRPNERGNREHRRRWNDRGHNRQSPMTPQMEDRKPHDFNQSFQPDHREQQGSDSEQNDWTQDQDSNPPKDQFRGGPGMLPPGHPPGNMPHPLRPGGPSGPPGPPGPPGWDMMGPGPGPNMGPRPMGPVGHMMGPGGPNMPPMPPGPMPPGPMPPGHMPPGGMPPFMGGPPNFPMPPNWGPNGPRGPCGPGGMPPNMMGPNGPMPFFPPFNPSMMGPPGPPPPPPPTSLAQNSPNNSMTGSNGPPVMGQNMPPNSGPPGPPGGPGMRPIAPPNSMSGPNGPPGPPGNMMGPNGPRPLMPPGTMPMGHMGNPFMMPRPPFGPNSNFNNPNMPFMPRNSMGPPRPELKPADNNLSSEPMKLQNIPPPMPLTLNQIPKPVDLELGDIPAPSKSSQDSFPPTVVQAASEVAANGDRWENVLKAIHTQDQNMWFLHNPNGPEYKAFRKLIEKMREDREQQNSVKDEDKYEPEFCLDDDDSNDARPHFKDEGSNSNNDSNSFWQQYSAKREATSSQSDDDSVDNRRERRKRKKKSRWGDEPQMDLKPPGVVDIKPPGLLDFKPPGLMDVKPPGLLNPLQPQGLLAGAQLARIDENGLKLTNLNRNNQALMQYAMTNYGSTNLDPEEWKKCEDNFKLNLLYQDMLKKRSEVERLAAAGKHKYEYDSDEDTSAGTWEHKLRSREMNATEKWADELTKQAAGKHHIGDFLPPEELRKFMEKYSAVKGGKEPDLSDYKEFKLKEDNVGFKMLQKFGWSEGQGLGADGSGIVDPINKAQQPVSNLGLGAKTGDIVSSEDDEFDAYRKRMMLAYRFRPNPLNNPRRPYY